MQASGLSNWHVCEPRSSLMNFMPIVIFLIMLQCFQVCLMFEFLSFRTASICLLDSSVWYRFFIMRACLHGLQRWPCGYVSCFIWVVAGLLTLWIPACGCHRSPASFLRNSPRRQHSGFHQSLYSLYRLSLKQPASLPDLCVWFDCFPRFLGWPWSLPRCIVILTSALSSQEDCLLAEVWQAMHCSSLDRHAGIVSGTYGICMNVAWTVHAQCIRTLSWL